MRANVVSLVLFPALAILLAFNTPEAAAVQSETAQQEVMYFDENGVAYLPGDLYATDHVADGAAYWNLRYVPATGAGGFTQGSPTSEPGHYKENQFQHILTRNIAVMETEVSRQMWADLLAKQASLPPDPSPSAVPTNHPCQASWCQSVLFANLLSVQQGLTRCYHTDSTKSTPIDATNYTAGGYYCDFDANGYRMPTEGEWEYFTRAGTTTPFSISEPNYNAATMYSCTAGVLPNLESVAVYCANSVATMPVGSLLPNPWNLRDVHGNLYEWCWDWADFYPPAGQTDYAGPATGAARIVRGAAYHSIPVNCRSATRAGGAPGIVSSYVGFRLVRTLASPVITMIKSKKAIRGSPATIFGTGFSATKSGNAVYFGKKKADLKTATATRLQVTIPSKCKKGVVGVYATVNGLKSNTFNFQVR
ncbi:MAG: SUMF1/EgtB/PvdO family nonheme iron enzyme [Acidobacteriota bacterium]